MPHPYELTAAEVVAKARRLTQDEDTQKRNKDAEIFGWITDAVSSLVAILPEHFATSAVHTCAAGAYQIIELPRSAVLLDILGVPQADMDALTAFQPAWQSAAAGAIKNWMRKGGEPLAFYCYPPAAVGQEIPVICAVTPQAITDAADVIQIPEKYEPALVDYVVAMLDAKDDENISTGRAAAAMRQFIGRITGQPLPAEEN